MLQFEATPRAARESRRRADRRSRAALRHAARADARAAGARARSDAHPRRRAALPRALRRPLSAAATMAGCVAIEDSTSARAGAEARGLERGRAPHRARDQESADADPALRRADRAKFRNSERSRRRSTKGRSTIVSEVGQLKRMVDEFARFARMPAVHLRHAQLAEILQQAAEPLSRCEAGRHGRRRPSTRTSKSLDRSRTDPPRRRQSAEERRRGDRIAARSASPPAARRTASSSKSPIPAAAFPTPTRKNSSSHTFQPKAAAPASAWPSSTASSAITTASISVHDNHPQGTRFEIELPA